MLMLCVLGGMFLLVRAPEFFMPAQWDPSIGRSFDPLASRLPGPAAQRRHFALLLAALVLIGAALARAEVGPNPEYRAPLRTGS